MVRWDLHDKVSVLLHPELDAVAHEKGGNAPWPGDGLEPGDGIADIAECCVDQGQEKQEDLHFERYCCSDDDDEEEEEELFNLLLFWQVLKNPVRGRQALYILLRPTHCIFLTVVGMPSGWPSILTIFNLPN